MIEPAPGQPRDILISLIEHLVADAHGSLRIADEKVRPALDAARELGPRERLELASMTLSTVNELTRREPRAAFVVLQLSTFVRAILEAVAGPDGARLDDEAKRFLGAAAQNIPVASRPAVAGAVSLFALRVSKPTK